MKRRLGFALLEVLLAVILMTIAAAASYTLVKSFRSNSATQQFIRYATDITQNYMPFLDAEITSTDDASAATVFDPDMNKLSKSFLLSIGIPTDDLDDYEDSATRKDSNGNAITYCYVKSGMYASSGTENVMNFAISTNNSVNYFIISVVATGVQVNQVLQNASSLFSVFTEKTDGTLVTGLVPKDSLDDDYYLFLVFPKSGSTLPAPTNFAPVTS